MDFLRTHHTLGLQKTGVKLREDSQKSRKVSIFPEHHPGQGNGIDGCAQGLRDTGMHSAGLKARQVQSWTGPWGVFIL